MEARRTHLALPLPFNMILALKLELENVLRLPTAEAKRVPLLEYDTHALLDPLSVDPCAIRRRIFDKPDEVSLLWHSKQMNLGKGSPSCRWTFLPILNCFCSGTSADPDKGSFKDLASGERAMSFQVFIVRFRIGAVWYVVGVLCERVCGSTPPLNIQLFTEYPRGQLGSPLKSA